MDSDRPSLVSLPDEVLLEILYYIPPESTIALKRTSKRFLLIVEEDLLWRYHCCTHFRYWSPRHDLARKLAARVSDTNWKQLFIDRKAAHRNIQPKMDDLLSTQYKRIQKMEDMVEEGFDAKEPLIEQYRCLDDAEDVLARRFYSEAVLASIYRRQAIEIWTKIQRNEVVPLEDGLACFDLFVVGPRGGDLTEIKETLDRFAAQAREEIVDLERMTPREQARAVILFVRKHNLTGISESENYHNIKHTFLGIAVRDPRHQSLPLISVAIFCCIAQRLGIDAHPCAFPMHVYGVILPPADMTLDGVPKSMQAQSNDLTDVMYVDPFRSDFETPPQNLRAVLRHMGLGQDNFEEYMGPATVKEMVSRTARNLTTAIDTQQESLQFPDTEDAFYSMVWALILMAPLGPGGHLNFRQRQLIPHLSRQFEAHFPWDCALIEQYILPISMETDADGQQLLATVRAIRARDSQRPQHPRRPQDTEDNGSTPDPKYFVGQLFQHKRYRYEGIVIGWDRRCEMSEEWMSAMRVNQLVQGRRQSFYHVIASDRSKRYVAEENIQPLTTQPSAILMKVSGQCFKRWDNDTKRFVSNIQDEYPDD